MLSYVPGAGSSAAVIQVVCLGGETCVEDKARETGRPRTRLRPWMLRGPAHWRFEDSVPKLSLRGGNI